MLLVCCSQDKSPPVTPHRQSQPCWYQHLNLNRGNKITVLCFSSKVCNVIQPRDQSIYRTFANRLSNRRLLDSCQSTQCSIDRLDTFFTVDLNIKASGSILIEPNDQGFRSLRGQSSCSSTLPTKPHRIHLVGASNVAKSTLSQSNSCDK